MNVLSRTLLFSVALVLAFSGVTYMLPQMEGPAPEQQVINVSELTMESFVALGKELYAGKGACALCHNELGRAPDMLAFNVTEVSLQRIADPRYEGSAVDAEGYLRESMLRPTEFVVAGFGTKGSNDTVSPMPAIDKAPAQLSALEIDAIIAFLQDKDGEPVSVPLPVATAETTAAAKAPPPPAVPQSAEDVIVKYGCAACHSILASEATLGPDLHDIAARQSAAEIRDSIVDPAAVVGDGFIVMMPEFPDMTIAELEMIVAYLTAAADDRT